MTKEKKNDIRVAIYARVSSEHEPQISALANQVEWYNDILACKQEWKFTKLYVDKGITGTLVTKRPQFLQMIADAKKHKFDLIITREVSRFARNTLDTLEYTRLLKSYGVEVFFLCDNIRTGDPDGELRLTIMAMLAQDESRKMSVRVKSGVRTAMSKGVVYGNGNVLGYDRVGKEMVINPEQAETVRIIFDRFITGESLPAIAKAMEQMGRKTSTGLTHWHPGTIKQIIENPFYCGTMVYNKYYVPDFIDHKAVVNHGEIEQTVVKGKHTPIISEEEFQIVQTIRNSRRIDHDSSLKRHPAGGRVDHRSFLGDVLQCKCGSNMAEHHTGRLKSSWGFRCSVAGKITKASRTKNGLRCDAKQLSAFTIITALNWIFSEWLFYDENRREYISKSLKKNEVLSEKEYTADEVSLLTELIYRKITEAAEKCKTENAPEDVLRLFIERVVTDGYSFDVYLCYNDLPVVPFRFRYELPKYEPLTRIVLTEKEIIADGISFYNPEPDERHQKKNLKIRIMI